MDGMFPMKSSANESYGKIPMVYNPTNQTTKIGKFPIDTSKVHMHCTHEIW